MKHETKAMTEDSSADDAEGSESICNVPNTNDWYVTTERGITLGPYRSRQEAVSMVRLLCLRNRSADKGSDWEAN